MQHPPQNMHANSEQYFEQQLQLSGVSPDEGRGRNVAPPTRGRVSHPQIEWYSSFVIHRTCGPQDATNAAVAYLKHGDETDL